MKTEPDLDELLNIRRWIYYIPLDAFIEGYGFRVSIVIEGERGHFPTGDWPYIAKKGHRMPWFWGMTYEEAEQIAAEQNDKLGYDAATVWKILSSSVLPAGKR